jgi:hypothetical protein
MKSAYDRVEIKRARRRRRSHTGADICMLEEVAPQIQVEAEPEPEQRLDGRAPEPRSESGADLKAADDHGVSRTAATRSAACHSEQLDTASHMASARGSRWTRTRGGLHRCWSMVHLPPLPPPSLMETLGMGEKRPVEGSVDGIPAG